MALTQVSYPITGTAGSYQNAFPSQKPLSAEFLRKDIGITSISSGTDNKVRILADANFSDIQLGQYVTWKSDGYTVNSAKVITLVSADTIEVDVVFTNSIATNGFVNYFRNYFLEIRYVADDTSTDDQNAIEIISDYDQIPNNNLGEIDANISTPADLIVPDFSIQTGVASDLFISYRIQYRESYDGNRAGLWVSPAINVEILLIHASKSISVGDFTDINLTKRYTRGYPLITSFVYSNVNDAGVNNIKIYEEQLDITGAQISTQEVADEDDLNGVFLLVADTSLFGADTTFLRYSFIRSTNQVQYDPSQYDPSQYG